MNIDFELIKSLYANTTKEESENEDVIEPMEYLDKNKLYDLGINLVRKNDL